MAWGLCLALAAGGVSVVAANFGKLITGLYSFGLFLGTVYSVPPLRLKQFAVPAFMIIATVRGFLLNFGVYYATRAALGLPFEWSPPIRWAGGWVMVVAGSGEQREHGMAGQAACRSPQARRAVGGPWEAAGGKHGGSAVQLRGSRVYRSSRPWDERKGKYEEVGLLT